MNPSKRSEKLVKPLLIGAGVLGSGVVAQATWYQCVAEWNGCYDNCLRYSATGEEYAACTAANACDDILLQDHCYC